MSQKKIKNEGWGEEEGGRTSLYGENLLSHHRQHLQVNAVELIKTGPGSTGQKALDTDIDTDSVSGSIFSFFNNVMNDGSDGAWTDFKKFPQSDVVQSVRAVEDDTLLRHGFGQVLGRLRLPRPGRTFWCSTQMKLESSKQGAVRGGVDAVVMATMNNL